MPLFSARILCALYRADIRRSETHEEYSLVQSAVSDCAD